MVTEANTLCTYALCMLDCRRPQFIEACNTTVPWTLTRTLIGKTMAPATTVMKELDIEKIMPKTCRKMAMLEDDEVVTTMTPTVMPTTTYVVTEPTTLVEMTKICTQPMVEMVTECTTPMPMWWFNMRTMKCETFTFCPTITTIMMNRFETMQMCMNVCGGMIVPTVTTTTTVMPTTTDDFETLLEAVSVPNSDFSIDSNETIIITNTTKLEGDKVTIVKEKITEITVVEIED